VARSWGDANLRPGDEILLTEMEHHSNLVPWQQLAERTGAVLRYIPVTDEGTLALDQLDQLLTQRTRMVAFTAVSNVLGTNNPVERIVSAAHAVDAVALVDAAQHTPHQTTDVQRWGADFVVFSAHKMLGPSGVGILWGRRELLTELPAYKVRPAADTIPDRWMTGTQSHEAIAGTLAAIEYLADLGRRLEPNAMGRREALQAAYAGIAVYERALLERMLDGLGRLPGVKVWGITDPQRFDQRVPTVSITHERLSPETLATQLGERGIFVWHGNFYALPLTEALGLEPEGMVRIGLLHYNTADEVQRLFDVLAELG